MSTYHPLVEILVDRFGTLPESLEPLHEQLVAYRESTNGLKEVLLKHDLISEASFQKAMASYFELEYRESLDEIPVVQEYTEIIPIRYAKKNVFFPLKKENNTLEVAKIIPINAP